MAKIGVIHYNWPGFSFEQFLEFAAQIGCTHVELAMPDVWHDHNLEASPAQLQEAAAATRDKVASYGLQVSALGAGNNFVQSDETQIASQVARMKKVCEIVKILGPDAVVRSEGGQPTDELGDEQQWASMRNCFQQCIPFLDELGVSLAVDNHGVLTNEGDKLIALLNELNHPRIGSNLDTMNFRWLGNSVEDCNRFYEQLAPRVLHAHLKDGFDARENYKGAALGEGEIDLDFAVAQLKAAGFDGVYTAEYEGPEPEGGVGYKKCVEWLKKNV